ERGQRNFCRPVDEVAVSLPSSRLEGRTPTREESSCPVAAISGTIVCITGRFKIMRIHLKLAIVVVAVLATLASSLAEAQWVLLARRVVGKVQQMSQQSTESQGAGYDSAAVILEAPADKVYATVVRGVKNRQDLTITREDASAMLVQ